MASIPKAPVRYELWQHTQSGERFGVMLTGDGQIIGVSEALHHSETGDLAALHYGDEDCAWFMTYADDFRLETKA